MGVCASGITKVTVSMIFARIAVMQTSTKWCMPGVDGSVVDGVGEEAEVDIRLLVDLDVIL